MKEEWSFICVADMQPGSPKSFRYNPAHAENWRQARRQILDQCPELILVPGDLTRDGSLHRYELEAVRADLESLGIPFRVVPGNMDAGNKHTRLPGIHRTAGQATDEELNVTSDQLRHFADVFGPLWWSFDHRGVRFSGVTDMVINSGLPEEARFWDWAEEQQRRPPARLHVWIMHYAPFILYPDEPNWDISDPAQYFAWYFSVDQPGRGRLMELFKATHATVVFSGHVHCPYVMEHAGIRFEVAPATSFTQTLAQWPDVADPALGFLRCVVTETGIRSELVPLEKAVTPTPGYGPGGHPAPELRDYSLAWEPGGCPEC